MSIEPIEDLKDTLLKLKQQNKITDKLRVYLEGYLQALFEQNIITLKEVEQIERIAEINKADPFGVGELLTFGNIEEYLNSKLEF